MSLFEYVFEYGLQSFAGVSLNRYLNVSLISFQLKYHMWFGHRTHLLQGCRGTEEAFGDVARRATPGVFEGNCQGQVF